MSESQTEFIKNLRRSLINAGVGYLFLAVITQVSFYFTSKAKFERHEDRIELLEQGTVTRYEYDGHILLQDEVDKNIINVLQDIKRKVEDLDQ